MRCAENKDLEAPVSNIGSRKQRLCGRLRVASPTRSKGIEMTSRVVNGITPRIAACVAAMTFTLVAPPAGAQTNAGTSPQIDSRPSLAEEAPHIVPVLQPPAASAASKSDRSQPSLGEDAPHIVPVMPEGPGAAYTRAPVE